MIAELTKYLERGTAGDASVVCQAIESHARNLPLENTAIVEFYEFCLLLFDRCFGEDTTRRAQEDLPPNWVAYRCGGWLRKLSFPSSSELGKAVSTTSQININPAGMHIYQLLTTDSRIMDVLRRGYEKYKWPLTSFPEKIKMVLNLSDPTSALVNHPTIKFIQTPNLQYVSNWVKQTKDQTSTQQTLALSPVQYFLLLLLRYPTTDEFVFSLPITESGSTQRLEHPIKINTLLQTNCYFMLLSHYIMKLFPNFATESSIDTKASLSEDGEWFLRLAALFWVDMALVVRQDREEFVFQRYGDVMSVTAAQQLVTQQPPNTPLSPVTLLDDNPPLHPTPALQCVYLLLNHFLSDSKLDSVCRSLAECSTPRQHLPPALRILQQPLFDMLRLNLSRGGQPTCGTLAFQFSCHIWLLYIQPWTASSTGQAHQPQKYSPAWDYYIAANLHFYTTVLAIFFSTVSQVSIDPADPEGPSFLVYLSSVLRVFSGDLLSTVSIMSKGFNTWYIENLFVHASSSTRSGFLALGAGPAHIQAHADTNENNRFSFGSNNAMSAIQYTLTMAQHELLLPDFGPEFFSSPRSEFYPTPIPYFSRLRSVESLLASALKLVRVKPQSWIRILIEELGDLIKVDPSKSKAASTLSRTDLSFLLSQLTLIGGINQLNEANSESSSTATESCDNLDMPSSPLEWAPAVNLTVFISKSLNSFLSLPKIKETSHLSWDAVLHSKDRAATIVGSIRVNLRPLANLTLLVFIAVTSVVWGFALIVVGLIDIRIATVVIGSGISVEYIGKVLNAWFTTADKEDSHAIRDFKTGKLTERGRKLLVNGQLVCRADEIRFAGDTLFGPQNTGESVVLLQFFFWLSQCINLRYQLPREKNSSGWPWRIVLIDAWKNRATKSPLLSVVHCCRFNLRPFASLRTDVFLAVTLYILNVIAPNILMWTVLGASTALCSLVAFLEFTKT